MRPGPRADWAITLSSHHLEIQGARPDRETIIAECSPTRRFAVQLSICAIRTLDGVFVSATATTKVASEACCSLPSNHHPIAKEFEISANGFSSAQRASEHCEEARKGQFEMPPQLRCLVEFTSSSVLDVTENSKVKKTGVRYGPNLR